MNGDQARIRSDTPLAASLDQLDFNNELFALTLVAEHVKHHLHRFKGFALRVQAVQTRLQPGLDEEWSEAGEDWRIPALVLSGLNDVGGFSRHVLTAQ